MKKLTVPFVAFVSCLASSRSEILSAPFEEDAINSPPDSDLPNSPTTDKIQFNLAMEPQPRVQNFDIWGSKARFT